MTIVFTKNKLNDYSVPSHNKLIDILVTLHTSDIELTTSFYKSVVNKMIPFYWESIDLPRHTLDTGLWWNLVDYCIDVTNGCSRWHFKRVSSAPYKNMQDFLKNFEVKTSVCAREYC